MPLTAPSGKFVMEETLFLPLSDVSARSALQPRRIDIAMAFYKIAAMYPRATFLVLTLCVYAAAGGVALWMGLSVQHVAVMVTGALWRKT
jgi:hypothetical protein